MNTPLRFQLYRLNITHLENAKRHTPIGVLLNHLEKLKGLEHLAGHVLGSYAVVGRANTVPLTTTIDLGHGANTSTSTEVQVTDSGCCEYKTDGV